MASVNSSVPVPLGLTHFYYICFLTGFVLSAAVYCILHYVFPVPEVQRFVESAPSVETLVREDQDQCDEVEAVVSVGGKV